MKKLIFALAILCLPAFGARTRIVDTLRRADGSYCSGKLAISWPTFTSTSNQLIYAGSFQSNITNTGGVDVSLEPGNYTVGYLVAPPGCTPSTEYWFVPTSATPVTIADVRTIYPPTPPAQVALSSISQSGATVGQCPTWDGSDWVPGACATASNAFSAITTGVNTSATMTVGTGAVFTYTGGGIINASRILNTPLTPLTGIGVWTAGIPSAIATTGLATDCLLGNGSFGSCATAASQWTTTGNDIYNNNSGNVGIGGAPGNYKLDISKSGSTATVRFYDQTAINGVTRVIVRAAPNQSASSLMTFQDSSGTDQITLIDNGSINASNFVVGVGFDANVNGVALKDVGLFKWSSTSSYAGTADTGFGRLSAGLMSVNDGITGTAYRDLKLRDITINSQAGGGTQCAQLDNDGKIAGTGALCGTAAAGTGGFGFTFGDPAGSALTAGTTTTGYFTIPFACTITGWNIVVDAGTATFKVWRKATGTAIPTAADSINTSGISISSGTAVHSATVTDFTSTAIAANDIIAINLDTVATAKYANLVVQCDR